ncbi:DUF427 domain-containing protein [Halomonas sp. A40-4]|uniref:DUF427 domain-containing protein n=1 Tax=Halomonas sp. A40-4 TaxID=2785909 RepID=UPI001E38E7FE|nr:DUF427 domain-containing protein [Halomonas sp. A40-4]
MPQALRIELHPVSQRVQLHVDGKLLADSAQALELRETGYPPRHYIPREDVRMDFLPFPQPPLIARLRECIVFHAARRSVQNNGITFSKNPNTFF